MYNHSKTAISYCLEIPKEDFLLILADDGLKGFGYTNAFLNNIKEIFDVEFNGHFGSAIYYSVSVDDDKTSLHKKIKKGIREIVERLRSEATETL